MDREHCRGEGGVCSGHLLIKLIGTVLIILACSSAAHALQVTLGWEVPVTGPPDGYRVFSRLEGQSYDYGEPVWEDSATICTLSDLQDTTSHFVVRAYNSYGESDDSNAVTYEPSPSPPSPTTHPLATVNPSRVTLVPLLTYTTRR